MRAPAARAEAPAPRVRVGPAGDEAEHAADRVAEMLVAPAKPLCTACAAGAEPCPACAGGARKLRRSALGPAPAAAAPVLRGPGAPLPAATRAKFERRLDTDLSALRLHDGAEAARAARSVNARAFALGRDIAFGAAAPAPDTAPGERLLAHEVAHTLQDGAGAVLRRQPLDGGVADAGAPVAGVPDAGTADATAPTTAPATPPGDIYARIEAIVGAREGEGYRWVGPLDESSVEALYTSLGDQALTDLADPTKRNLWTRSIERGAELFTIPAVRRVQRRFITEVANVARGYLDENTATAQREKAAIGADPSSAPTPDQAAAIEARRQAAENIRRARMAQAAMRMLKVGYDHVSVRYALFESTCHPIRNEQRDLAVKPFHPQVPPHVAPRGDECIAMPNHARVLVEWNRMTAVQEGEMNRFPSLYALARELDEEDIATSEAGVTTGSARERMLRAMDRVLANIAETYPRLGEHLPYELHPIHRQLFARPPWNTGIEGEAAHAVVDEYQDAEFWRSMGLAAVQMALFVVATMATGGLAALAFGAAAGVGVGQAANSIRKWEELDAAYRTNLSDETALVTSGQVGGALFTAVLDTAFAFLDVYSAAHGIAALNRGLRGAAGAAPATLEAATEAEARVAAQATAQVAEQAGPDLARRLATPGAARPVQDEALRRAGYVLEAELEQAGERHIFRRRADGTWCRFSTRICGLSFGPDVERAARAALREAEAPAEVAAARAAVEGTAHEAPRLLDPAVVAGAVSRLSGRFPILGRLTPGAMERIVRAGFAIAEEGGLRRARRWASAVRGQLLEEIASARVRGLLASAEGRAALGLDRNATDLIFIEGSRIRDRAGLQITDGVIARRIGDRIEIVAVLESKAGAWAATGLTDSLTGLRRMGAEDLLEGLMEASSGRLDRGVMAQIRTLDPALHAEMTPARIGALDDAGRLALRDRILGVIDRLPEGDLRALKDMMQTGEGQVSRDIERLMSAEDRTVDLMIHDGAGRPLRVTAELPTRPRFLGAVPSDVAMTDMTTRLGAEGFRFESLAMGDMAMTRDQLEALARAIIGDLGPTYETAANAAARSATPPAP
jgi:hypothetical protein